MPLGTEVGLGPGDFMFHATLDAVGNILRVSYKS